MNLQDLDANLEFGAPLTEQEFRALQSGEQSQSTSSLAPETSESNPFVFDDDPVNHNKFAVLSILSNSMNQRHQNDCTVIKIRGAFASMDAIKRAKIDNEGCDLFACEMYKFCILPCSADVMALSVEERDEMMNESLRLYEAARLHSNDEFERRKRDMLSDLERQEEIKRKVNEGVLPTEAIESQCIFPEPLAEKQGVNSTDAMDSDRPVNSFTFAVMAVVDMNDVESTELPEVMRGKTIFKLCGAFQKEEEANRHAKRLRKAQRYKHIDVCVAHMYEWLPYPPNIELLPVVHYDQNRLTEAVGALQEEVTPMQALTDMNEATVPLQET